MARTLAAALFALSLIPASAAHAGAANTISVAYGDLDLGAAAGRSELKARLADAAAKLCSPVAVGPDYRGSDQSARESMALYHACIGRLSERAMAQIPMSKTGRD
jgi:UrcA family protein